jgi:hypothetical protein
MSSGSLDRKGRSSDSLVRRSGSPVPYNSRADFIVPSSRKGSLNGSLKQEEQAHCLLRQEG